MEGRKRGLSYFFFQSGKIPGGKFSVNNRRKNMHYNRRGIDIAETATSSFFIFLYERIMVPTVEHKITFGDTFKGISDHVKRYKVAYMFGAGIIVGYIVSRPTTINITTVLESGYERRR